MPQIINSGGNRSGKPESKPKATKSGGGSAVKASADINDVPKPLLIGAGVVLLVFLVFLVGHFVVPSRPAGPGYVKVPPPPGYPDVAPYNSKDWQTSGMRHLSGMPPPEVMQKWKSQGTPPKGGQ